MSAAGAGRLATDASVLVSYYVHRDVHRAASRAWLARTETDGQRLVTPSFALAEVSGAVARRTGSTRAATAAVAHLRALPHLGFVEVDAELIEDAIGLAGRLRIAGSDALYVALAERLVVPLVTWDRELLVRAAAVITVMHP